MPSKKDIFDQIAPDSQKGDVFDQISPDSQYQQQLQNRPIPQTSLPNVETQHGTGFSGAVEGLRDGFKGLGHSLRHPIDTATAQGTQAIAGGVTPYGTPMIALTGNKTADAQNQELQQGARDQMAQQGRDMAAHPAYTAGQFAAPVVAGAAASGLFKLSQPLFNSAGEVLQSGGAKVSNFSMGTLPDKFGGDPGLAAAQNNISGWTPKDLFTKTMREIPKVSAEHQASLKGYSGPGLDIGDAVSQPFKDVRASSTNPLTGAATPTQVAKLNKTQALLTHVPDSFSGQPTTALRPLNSVSPIDSNTLKSNLYGLADYDSPTKSSLANSALKQAAFGVKSVIQDAVPESVPSGDNLHNLMALKGEMAEGGGGIPTSRGGLVKNIARKGGTYAGAKLYSGGNLLKNQATNSSPGLRTITSSAPISFPVSTMPRDEFGNPVSALQSFWTAKKRP